MYLELVYGKERFFQSALNTGKAFLQQAFGRLYPGQPKFSSQKLEFRGCLKNVMVSFLIPARGPQALDPLQISSHLPQAIGQHVLQFELGQNLSFNRIGHYDHLRHRVVREFPNLLLINANRVRGGPVGSFFNDG